MKGDGVTTMRKAACGFERLVTRSLAIVAIAVAGGAAYSWLHGPLEPGGPLQANNQANQTKSSGGPEVGPGDNDGGAAVETDPTAEPGPGEAATLPEGHINLEDAHAHWMNATAVFIDARPKDDFEAGHIEGALNLSLEMTADADRYAEVAAWLDAELPIILYCRGGLCSEAKDVGRLLKGAGYHNILILDAGFPGWQEAGYAVGTGPGQ